MFPKTLDEKLSFFFFTVSQSNTAVCHLSHIFTDQTISPIHVCLLLYLIAQLRAETNYPARFALI